MSSPDRGALSAKEDGPMARLNARSRSKGAVLPDRGLWRQLAATFSADRYWLHRTAVWPYAYNDLL